MNPLYDQINLQSQSCDYNLISFNGKNICSIRFHQNPLELTTDGIWKKVKACIDGTTVDGYLDISNLKIKDISHLHKETSYLSSELSPEIKLSRLINELIIEESSISTEEKIFLSSLMHLGISYDDYNGNIQYTAINFFKGTSDKEKIDDYYARFKSARSDEERTILKTLACHFISSMGSRLVRTIRAWPRELGYDKTIMMAILKENPSAFFFASETLQNDKDIVLASLGRHMEFNIHFASETLQNDKTFILEAIKKYPLLLQELSETFKNDEDIVKAAVSQNGLALQFAPDELQNNPGIVTAAVSQNGLTLQFASIKLQNNQDVVTAAVSQNGLALQFASIKLRNNQNVVTAAISQNGLALQFASFELQNNQYFAIAAVSQNGFAVEYLPIDLQNDKKFAIAAVSQNGHAIDCLLTHLQNDPIIIKASYNQLCSKIISNIAQTEITDPDSLISFDKICRLIEGYEKFKDNQYSYNEEANRYIKAIMESRIKEASKIKKHLLNQIAKNKLTDSTDLFDHLELESTCLKCLGLENPKHLRITIPLIKEIMTHPHKNYFFNIIESYSKESLKNFLEKLSYISGGTKHLIIQSIILSSLNITEKKRHDLYTALKNRTKILRDANLQNFIDLEIKLTSITPKLSDEKIAYIILNILNSDDKHELLKRLNFLIFIANLTPEKIDLIDNFHSENLFTLLLTPLIKVGILEEVDDVIIKKFQQTFLSSRIPDAIFSYSYKFINDETMLLTVKKFIDIVINDNYLKYRHDHNSHKNLLTDDQKASWETEINEKLNPSKSEELVFDPLTFLTTKLITDHHGDGKLDRLIGSIQSGAAISHPNTIEKLCLDLLTKKKPIEQLNILKELQTALETEEFKDIEFKNDVKDQINLMKSQSKKEFNLIIKDTEDWQDLFFCGTEVEGSCQRIYGEPIRNKCLLGYVLDGKTRMIKIGQENGQTISRSIIKIMKDPLGNPALLLERVYPNDKYASDIKKFAKQKAEALGINLYEYSYGNLIELKSEGNIAPFEYEDAGIGVTNGVYEIKATLIK